MVKLIIGLFAFVVSGAAFASGFICEGGQYRVKLNNIVHGATRTPAVLVISHASAGTLLVRKYDEIRKHVRANTTQFVVEGNRKIDADEAILQVPFIEGIDKLEDGEELLGGSQLILIADGEGTPVELACTRKLNQ